MRFSPDDRSGKTLGFYVQAGPRIGFGHVSRALALAEACDRKGWGVRFYSENDLRAARFFSFALAAPCGHPGRRVRKRVRGSVLTTALAAPCSHPGCRARKRVRRSVLTPAAPRFTRLRKQSSLGAALRRDGVDTLVVDVPRRDERVLRGWGDAVRRLVVIDDWDADCTPADLLVNGHVLWSDRVVRKHRQVRLMGLRFALLKPQWARARSRYRLRRDVRNVLVTFGGSDPQDMAGRLVPRLARRFPSVNFISILGPGYRGRLRQDRRLPGNVRTIRNAASIVSLVLEADAAVGAVGVTMYELASTGVPTVLVDSTPGHGIFMEAMDKQGLALCARNEHSVPERLGELLGSAQLRRRISRTGRRRLDGRGVERVAAHVESSYEAIGHA